MELFKQGCISSTSSAEQLAPSCMFSTIPSLMDMSIVIYEIYFPNSPQRWYPE
jgi:hypothetical protein